MVCSLGVDLRERFALLTDMAAEKLGGVFPRLCAGAVVIGVGMLAEEILKGYVFEDRDLRGRGKYRNVPGSASDGRPPDSPCSLLPCGLLASQRFP